MCDSWQSVAVMLSFSHIINRSGHVDMFWWNNERKIDESILEADVIKNVEAGYFFQMFKFNLVGI